VTHHDRRRVPIMLATRPPLAWQIVDHITGRPYLDVRFPSAALAERERLVLLRGFPTGHEWRTRLRIAPRYDAPAPPPDSAA
jgi:hypothetical protein